MSTMSRASSNPLVDLEKGAAAAAEEEELAVVDPRIAMCVKVTLDLIVTVYSLFFIGLIVWLVKICPNWWDPWPDVLLFGAAISFVIWWSPAVKEAYIRRYAMKRTAASDSDVTTKLLASKK